MHGHEVDRVERLENGVRLVSGGERVEVIGDARKGCVAAVLDAAYERAHLLQVLPRLLTTRTAEFAGVRDLGQD